MKLTASTSLVLALALANSLQARANTECLNEGKTLSCKTNTGQNASGVIQDQSEPFDLPVCDTFAVMRGTPVGIVRIFYFEQLNTPMIEIDTDTSAGELTEVIPPTPISVGTPLATQVGPETLIECELVSQ